jgi:hypothetical protein
MSNLENNAIFEKYLAASLAATDAGGSTASGSGRLFASPLPVPKAAALTGVPIVTSCPRSPALLPFDHAHTYFTGVGCECN